MTDEFDIESQVSDRAVEYAANHIGEDIEIGAVVVPPVPRDKIAQVIEDYDAVADDADALRHPVKGHLYDLTDLSLAINHIGDTMLDQSVDGHGKYNVSRESLSEIKVARGALLSTYNRELRRMATTLDIDPTQDDLVNAIRTEVGYSVDVSVDEDWETDDAGDITDTFLDE